MKQHHLAGSAASVEDARYFVLFRAVCTLALKYEV
jgi:hypothetical protein